MAGRASQLNAPTPRPRQHEAASRHRPLSACAAVDAALTEQIVEIHAMSRGSYGAPRVHAEPRRLL